MKDKWEKVTSEQYSERNGGPMLRRIEVPGGWLYLADPSGQNQSPSMVFIKDPDRGVAWPKN